VEINNFYTSTVYEKGAEVVRMMHTLVGRDGFAKGMTLYFERFDGQAVTCDDFAQAVADANPRSELARTLPQFKRWYSQAGTPRLVARGRYDAPSRTYTLGIEQSGLDTGKDSGHASKEPFVIPLAIGLVARDGRALPVQLEDESGDAPPRTERLLVLEEARSFFTFVNVDVEPVPSLLRGFSAPVILVDGLVDADLLVLLQHDTDPFTRWEAGQRLALSRLLAAARAEQPVELDAPFIAAMRDVLRHPTLDAAFKDQVLALPAESYVAEQLTPVDPPRIHAVRQQMLAQIASALRADWEWAFDAHQVSGPYSPDSVSAGKRALANRALAMLCLDAVPKGETVWPGRALQRFKDAANMTDRLGALSALVRSRSKHAEPALHRFHELFRHEALVIDTWFTLQATAPEVDGEVFARVKQLLKHPDFSLRNPNRARSLLSSFSFNNPGAFHRADAAGCVLWAEQVVELDAINPQYAARLARSLDRWRQLAEPYRSAAREALARVAARPDLSDGVREIVTNALAL
jgi:aminopeptidase N